MERYEQVLRLIYDAIGEINERIESQPALDRSPDTVLIGESGKLDSMGVIEFIAAVEDKIERTFGKTIHVLDVVLLADEPAPVTAASLAARLVKLLDGDARG